MKFRIGELIQFKLEYQKYPDEIDYGPYLIIGHSAECGFAPAYYKVLFYEEKEIITQHYAEEKFERLV